MMVLLIKLLQVVAKANYDLTHPSILSHQYASSLFFSSRHGNGDQYVWIKALFKHGMLRKLCLGMF